MIVNFYTITKRPNSTLQPTGNGTQYDCRLKAPSSVYSPVLIIDTGSYTSAPAFNYAYIAEFSRYYFITDLTSDGRLWVVSLKCDVMATFKNTIGNWDMYILRSSAAYNGHVVDAYYPVLTDFTVNEQTVESPWAHIPIDGAPSYYISITRGCFILGVIATPESNNLGSYGSIKYILLKYNQLNTLLSALMSNVIMTNNNFSPDDATLALQKAIINPLSYIKSCFWVPIDYDDIPGAAATSVKIWDWTVNAGCKILSGNPYIEKQHSFTIPAHPSAGSRGRYLNVEPYTEYRLSFPPFGLININGMDVLDAASIRAVVCLDLITGIGRLEIYTENNGVRGRIILKTSAQVCVPIQLAEVGYDFSKSSLIGAGAGVLGSLGAGLAGLFDSGLSTEISKIGNAAANIGRHVESIGSSGNFSDLNGYVIMTSKFYSIAAENNADVGRPLCQIRKPSAIPGFMIARSGDVPISGTYEEQIEIRQYLEGGFFYE